MRDIHMNPAEAVQAHLDLGAARSVGMHFGTFQLTPEAIDDPIVAVDRERRERGVAPDRFCVPEFGESIAIP